MQIKNPEILLKEIIMGRDGQNWIVVEVSKYANPDTGPYLEFWLQTDVPVKSSPNQVYYSMMKGLAAKVELRIHTKQWEMIGNGEVRYGPIDKINTKEKFINVLVDVLPTNIF